MKRLLVFRFSAMGDVAMTVPVLYSLAKAYPELQITVVSRAAFQPFFEPLPGNISFIAADLHGKHKGIRGLFRLFRELHAMKFDAVADLHDVLRTLFLRTCFRLAGTHVEHIDKGRKEKKALTRRKNKVCKPLQTTFDRYAQVFRKLGFTFPLRFNSIFESAAPSPSLYQPYTENKGQNRWIGIAPFAKHTGKKYPTEKMEEVVKELSRNEDYRIFLFGGGQQELAALAEWEQKYPHTRTLSGKLQLNGELALIHQLDLMISMDSANMHLASLTGTPVISVWGATHPWAGFMGWEQSPENVVQSDMPCRPCSIFGNIPCYRNDYACMNRITPQMIIEKVNLLLKNR